MNSLSSLMEEVQAESDLRNKEIINNVIYRLNNDNLKIIDSFMFCFDFLDIKCEMILFDDGFNGTIGVRYYDHT